MARNIPASIPPTKTVGLSTDPDAWASGILMLGSGAAKLLSYAEHIDFLVSLRGETFKVIFDFWNGAGWWITITFAIGWFINRHSKRELPHRDGPTWGLMAASIFIAFVFGSLLSVPSSGGIPKVITSTTAPFVTQPDGTVTMGPCSAQFDGASVMSFKKEFKLALACAVTDPTKDVLSDKNIVVSDQFEIVPGNIPIAANQSPNGPLVGTRAPSVTINAFALLIPRETKWEKLTTLSDVMALGGKILDPRFYK